MGYMVIGRGRTTAFLFLAVWIIVVGALAFYAEGKMPGAVFLFLPFSFTFGAILRLKLDKREKESKS